ncbi:MAG: OmpH family outer membrane protein [Phycisphaerae bacterium]|nr:OmpH family outer membrane protein [Phycisphaerae bacterium]
MIRLERPLAAVVLWTTIGFLAARGYAQPTTTAPAAVPPPGSLGTVAVLDVVRIFEECDQIKDLNALLKEAQESYAKEAENRKKVLAQKEVELAAFSPDSPDYLPRRREFTRLNIEANVWAQTTTQELRREHFNWTRIVYEECLRAVEEVAKERGYSLVLQKKEFAPEASPDSNVDNLRQMIHDRGVVYADPALDITDAVIRKMNARYRERGGRAKLNFGLKGP